MIMLLINGELTDFQQWKFPAGEVGVKLPLVTPSDKADITLLMPSSDEIFICLNILNALHKQELNHRNIRLRIPYVPYGRQDRVCNEGESHALEVFTRVLLKAYPYFGTLYIEDPHSQVTVDLLTEWQSTLVVESQASCAKYLPKFDALIAPDKGAAEKVKTHYQVSALGVPCYTILKERKDGQVTYVDFPFDTIKGNVCVVDDICDGGATFLALAEMLYRTQPNMSKLSLYVTHGIFSKGVEELLKKYATIYVHNIMNKLVASSKSVTII
jgi:ribose-phosphate pyrophosphokinase